MVPLHRLSSPRRVHPFHAHLGAVGMANLADGVMQTGIGLLALTLTRSPSAMGALSAAVWLPWLLLGLSAGRGVDRWDRRRIMIVALTMRAILLLAVTGLAMAGHLTILILVFLALSYGITEVFVDLAAQAQVPALTGRSSTELQRANARLLSLEQITNGFIGPPLAGLLVGLGAAWVLGLPAVAVLAAVLVLFLGLRRWRAPATRSAPEDDEKNHLNGGLRILWRHPVLRPLIFFGALWNAGSTAMGAVLLLWMVGPGSAGALTPQTWGLVVIALPAGALLGSWLATYLLRRLPEMTVLLSCWAVGAAALVVPLISPSVAGMVAYGLIAGIAGVIGNVVSGSIRPRMIPDAQLGRVGGAARFVGFGIMPVSALTAGQLAAIVGIPAIMIAAAVTAELATLLAGATVSQKLINAHELT
ncbi:MFS transporter [Kocuria tytonicola]|nr:MFS transporter [Kocuria tytonicola]